MLTVSEETIRGVVEQVVAQLRSSPSFASMGNGRARTGAAGVHGSVDDAVAAAKEAFVKFSARPVADRRRAIQIIRDICVRDADPLGRMEMEETKIGRVDHKIEKLVTAGEKTPGVEFLRSDAASGDIGVSITEYAPFGVIGAITPVTHSLPTLASNAISMLAAGNTVVFNAHPSGANVAKVGLKRFNEAIRAAIGIDNLLCIIDPPTIESAEKLFAHRDVRLLVVTGGPAVARAALATNKRAIVAGPGNPPVVVDASACLERAAKSIIYGAAYDNNLLCIGEKEVFAVHSIFEPLLAAMDRFGGFRLSDQQTRDLERVVFSPAKDGAGTVLNKEFVGKDPADLGRAIGVAVPPGTQLLFGETAEQSPFVDHEQMTSFVPFVRVGDVDTAIALAKKYEHNFRHTAVMHSRDVDAITRMGRELDTTLFITNAPSTAGLGGTSGEGHLSFSIATPTGEGVTSPLTFTRQRRTTLGGSALRVI